MVGIAFVGNTATYAQYLDTGNFRGVTTVGTIELPILPDTTAVFHPDFSESVTRLVQTIDGALPRSDSQLAITLPYEMLVVSILTLDPSMEPEDRSRFLQWEFEQRMDAKSDMYTSRFYPLKGHTGSEVLSVGMPKPLIPALSKGAEHLDYTLISVEFDLLSSLPEVNSGERDYILVKYSSHSVSCALLSGNTVNAAILMDRKDGKILRACGSQTNRRQCTQAVQALENGELFTLPKPCLVFGSQMPDAIRNVRGDSELCRLIRPFSWISDENRRTILEGMGEGREFGAVSGLLHYQAGEALG